MNHAIELRQGPVVREEAIVLALALEAGGHALSVTPDGALLCTRGSALTPTLIAAIKAHRAHLIAIAGYTAPALEA